MIVSLMHLLSVQVPVDTLRGTQGYLPDPLLFCQSFGSGHIQVTARSPVNLVASDFSHMDLKII